MPFHFHMVIFLYGHRAKPRDVKKRMLRYQPLDFLENLGIALGPLKDPLVYLSSQGTLVKKRVF